jgi:hypothetical protein
MELKPTARDIQNRLEQQQRALVRLMKTKDGKDALDFLSSKYAGDVMERDVYQTHVRIGERRVIDYLLELREGEDNV